MAARQKKVATKRLSGRIDCDEVRQPYAKGVSKAEIARRNRTSGSTIRRALYAEPPVPAAPNDANNVQRQRALAVLDLVDQGLPFYEIARRLRTSQRSIRKMIAVRKAGGVPTLCPRPPSKPQAKQRERRIAQLGELTGKETAGPVGKRPAAWGHTPDGPRRSSRTADRGALSGIAVADRPTDGGTAARPTARGASATGSQVGRRQS